MKKIDIELTQRFVNEVFPNRNTIEVICFLQFIVCIFAIFGGYDSDLSIWVLLPLMTMGLIVFILTSTKIATIQKYAHLLLGLAGVFASLSCFVSSFLFVPKLLTEKVIVLLLMIALEIINIVFSIIYSFNRVRPTRLNKFCMGITGSMSAGISFGIGIGKVISRSIDFDWPTLFTGICIIFCWLFSFLYSYLGRYYYANVLIKLNINQES